MRYHCMCVLANMHKYACLCVCVCGGGGGAGQGLVSCGLLSWHSTVNIECIGYAFPVLDLKYLQMHHPSGPSRRCWHACACGCSQAQTTGLPHTLAFKLTQGVYGCVGVC